LPVFSFKQSFVLSQLQIISGFPYADSACSNQQYQKKHQQKEKKFINGKTMLNTDS